MLIHFENFLIISHFYTNSTSKTEGDNLGDSDCFSMILVESITSPKVPTLWVLTIKSLGQNFQSFRHVSFEGVQASLLFVKLEQVYFFCVQASLLLVKLEITTGHFHDADVISTKYFLILVWFREYLGRGED